METAKKIPATGAPAVTLNTSMGKVIEKTVEKVYKERAWNKTDSGAAWVRRHTLKKW